jgi:hypothetical protein
MAVATMDFDWLLDQASAIAFDPSRPSIYVFGLGMTPDALQEHVLSPMGEANLFAVADTKFIDGNMRGQYRGQLPRVAMTLFNVAGQQCGMVLSYHEKFPPDLSQYTEWSQFWHRRALDTAKA